ncbi:glycogen synthase GlgA [candidate division KSB1 bacterium]|nr:glycogen synthase GlgA [candidate division KSB1 bacterium]
MKKKLKILMALSEVAPFAKTGGLADVGSALPKALKDDGHDIRVIMPQYRVINERKYVLRDVIRLQDISVQLGKKDITVNVKAAFIPNSKVQVYFIDYKPFFFREGLYIDPKTGKEFSDNADRFTLFAKGTLETLKKLQWQPDIIHCNDWQTGLIPLFLKTLYAEDQFYAKIRTVFTVHNFVYQGIFPSKCLSSFNLNDQFNAEDSGILQHGKCNFLQAGLSHADLLNTVSETYCREVQSSPEYGCGMESLLQKRKRDFFGIVNGLDESVWNPESDELIPKKYSAAEFEGKQEAKTALLEQLQLNTDSSIPLIGVVSRLTMQKGFDLICDVLDDLMKLDLSMIILGVGDKKYETFFKKAEKKYKSKFKFLPAFDEPLAHLISAGSDIFLMPSLQEPCGLTQLSSLKYGTVPIVHHTGGLADTITSFHPKKKSGNGFVFNEPTKQKMFGTIKEALKLYENTNLWNKLIQNGMKEDHSWKVSSNKYVQLYQKCILK